MVNESDPIFEELKKHDIHLVSDEVIYPYAEDKDSDYDDVIQGDRLKNITLSVDYVPAVQPSDTLDIVNEELTAMTAGVSAPEDCAKKIQSRASIWMAEHR